MAKAAAARAKSKPAPKGKAKVTAKPKPDRKAAPKPMMTIAQRDRLLRAAAQIMEREGYPAFSIPAVARRARLDLKLVKRAFPSRIHLLTATLETNADNDTDAAQLEILNEIDFSGGLVGALAGMVRGQMTRHVRGGWLELYRNLDVSRRDPDLADMWKIVDNRLSDRAARIVEEMQRRGYISAELDPFWVQFFWNALMDGLAVRSRALPDPSNIQAIAEGLAPILLSGFAPKRA